MTYTCISVDEAKKLINKGDATILDIRDEVSFKQACIENAIHVTNENAEQIATSTDKTKPLIIYCYHGNSSKSAADYFASLGFTQAFSVDGGFELWRTQV